MFSDASLFAGAGYTLEQDTNGVHFRYCRVTWKGKKKVLRGENLKLCVLSLTVCNDLLADL